MRNKFIILLFCFIIYFSFKPVNALENNNNYILSLRDNYDFSWKEENDNYITSYDLKLTFEDTLGNFIEGMNVLFEIGPDKLADDPYGFGYVPYKSSTSTENRGSNLIEVLDIDEYITSTGEKYKFDHALVYVDGNWHKFTGDGIRWHIWCQNSSSLNEPTNNNYGWRGRYGTNETSYTITKDTEYRFVYKLVRYGNSKTVSSLDNTSGITFKMFNYFGDNDKSGINNNGIYDYFTFRDSSREIETKINNELDGDGFKENRAKVLSKLDSDGYPVFNCQGKCSNNPSLGYLFGSSKNPLGVNPNGVISYNPTNTILQKEIVDGVEYYYYDSNLNAVDYDIDNNKFLVRDYVERGYSISTYSNESNRYEFLPFNYLNNTSLDLVNPTTNLTYNYKAEEKDNWYGMTMEFDFYMPKNGMINDKDMIFSFSGDDDVWVFIDDVLVLDLGGTHGSVDGNINFKTGKVDSYLNWNGVNNKDNTNITTIYDAYNKAGLVDSVEWSDDKIYANYTKHTLKFFYLERGAAVANCKIRFNIPVLPMGSISVQKQFDGIDNYNELYGFKLNKVNNDVEQGVHNYKYTIGDKEYTTDEFGYFRLKAGEEAIFKLENNNTYYVEEIDSGDYATNYKCSLDGVDCLEVNKSDTFVINPDSAHQVVFTNRAKTFDLYVSKVVYGNYNDELFDFSLELVDNNGNKVSILDNDENEYVVDHDNGIVTFSLKNEDNVVIENIPINTSLTLKEVKHDGYQTVIKSGEDVLSNSDTYSFVLDSDKYLTVYNSSGVVLPNTGSIGMWYYLIIGISLFGIYYLYKLKEGE